MPFDNIYSNGVIFYKNSFIKIFKISPINYDLKSNFEKETILNSYKNFLKSFDIDVQILIQSKKEDISKTISQIKSIDEKNKKIKEIKEMYIKYISQINEEKNSSSKNFFIIIKKKIDILNKTVEEFANEESRVFEYFNESKFKLKDLLSRCGNQIKDVDNKEDVVKIINSFVN